MYVFGSKNGKFVLLTSCLSVALCGADGGSGGGRSEGCPRCIQEVFRWTLLVLSTLVLVQPLVEDFDHGIFFQNLSIKGTDPDAEQKKHVRKLVTKQWMKYKRQILKACLKSKRGLINSRYAPVLHLLVPVVGDWQVLVEAVVGGVAGRVVNDCGVPGTEKEHFLGLIQA